LAGSGCRRCATFVVAFNADGPDRLIDGKAPGARPRLNADQRDALKALVEQGPTPAAHGVVRWRLCDLPGSYARITACRFGEQTLSCVLRAMGFAKLSGRPRHHAQDPEAAAVCKKASPPV
jgi:hypothetical protein